MVTAAMPNGAVAALLGRETAAAVERLRRSVVTVHGRAGGGCGTVWRDDGLIVSNHHVVRGDHAEVETWEGRTLTADVVTRDPERDLVALRVEGDAPASVSTRVGAPLRVGELVIAIGNPWGRRGAATVGIVSSAATVTEENRAPIPDAIYADVRLAPGNSGGPLADARGRVIGINAMVSGGMGVAIPAAAVERFVAGGARERGVLGIVMLAMPLPAGVVAPAAAGPDGLMVTDVATGSAAERAGVIPGDILLAVDGGRGGARAIGRALEVLIPGESVRFDLLRGGELRSIDVVAAAA